MDIISKTLHHIGKNNKDTFVVQIGAMDGINFDDTRGFLDLYKWPAILVEPIPEIFTELKYNFRDRDNYIFEQCAITELDGEIEMLTIPKIAIEKENLHPGYRGMSALYPLKNGFGTDYQRDIDVKNNFGINIKVPTLTLDSLMNKYNIEKFDILICDVEGYDWNILKQLDFNKYRPKFIRLEYINLTDEEKKLTKQKLIDNGYVIEIGQDIDAVDKNLWDEIKGSHKNEQSNLSDIIEKTKTLSLEESQQLLKYLTEKPSKIDITNKDLTVVTGLWNIGRPGRDFDHYIEHFKKFLEIPINMFIYIESKYEHLIWEIRDKENTTVKIYELEDIKNIYAPFWDKTQLIRNNPDWYNKTGEGGWLKQSPQAVLEWYNPIVQSKMFLLNDVTIWNPFDTKYFIWLDAGITNTVYEKFFSDNRALDKITPYLDSFLFLSYAYDATDEIHGFDFKTINRYAGKKVEYVCRGGLFGGRKEVINEANAMYYSLLNRSISEGYMGTEESLFTIMSYLEPQTYRRYALDGNGLVVKFTQALIDGTVELEPVPEESIKFIKTHTDPSKLKVSLYMLTFNFPYQVEHTIQTWLKHPKWITNTRNILIDNSTNEEARIENAEICRKYNFEHIITNENTGINGGRFRAAKHFQESDSDYYLFLEDDMGIHEPVPGLCRNGFMTYVPDLYDKALKIINSSDIDFLKLSYTEVYMDNNIQVSWYNVPQHIRTEFFPDYDQLPITGLDPNSPKTKFNNIEVVDGLSYITGDIYYANWPTITGKKGNQKMFLDTVWERPYEQTWMSYMFQETKKGNLKPAILLASPVNHNRIAHYKPEERREN